MFFTEIRKIYKILNYPNLENYELNKKMRDAMLYLNELLKIRSQKYLKRRKSKRIKRFISKEIIIENKELLA